MDREVVGKNLKDAAGSAAMRGVLGMLTSQVVGAGSAASGPASSQEAGAGAGRAVVLAGGPRHAVLQSPLLPFHVFAGTAAKVFLHFRQLHRRFASFARWKDRVLLLFVRLLS
jgi:hypothetical protein